MYLSVWKSLTYYSQKQQTIIKLVSFIPKRKKTNKDCYFENNYYICTKKYGYVIVGP